MPKLSAPFFILPLAGVLFVASRQAPGNPHGLLSVLHVGQPVKLADAGSGYEITVIEGGPQVLAHKVVEVGSDFVVLEEFTGVQQQNPGLFPQERWHHEDPCRQVADFLAIGSAKQAIALLDALDKIT